MKLAVLYQSQALLRVRSPETLMLSVCHWMLALSIIVMTGSCLANTAASDPESHDSTTVSPAVDFRDGRLSLSANGISLAVLMQLVGDKAGFEVIANEELEAQGGSWAFTDLTVTEAVRRLLRDTNSIIVYRPGSGDADSTISRIYLLGSGSGPGNPGPVRIDTVVPSLENQLRMDQVESGGAGERIAAIDRSEGLTDDITLQNLAFALQHDPDPEVRIRAVSALEGIDAATTVTVLEAGIGDADAEVRMKVMQALAKIEDERIPLWLGQVLMGDPVPEVRLEALRAIARKEGDVAKIFIEAATTDSSELVSEAALRLIR
jgi:hypothetical protein